MAMKKESEKQLKLTAQNLLKYEKKTAKNIDQG